MRSMKGEMTMKKTYEHPEISVMLLVTGEILTTSVEDPNKDKDPYEEDIF